MNAVQRIGRISVGAVEQAAAYESGPLQLDSNRNVATPGPIVQRLGPQILSTLYMLVRNVRMYAPDNAIFVRPIETLVDAINSVVAATGTFSLQVDAKTLVINGASVKFDFAGLQSLSHLAKELEARNIGGFSTDRPINSQEICAFLAIFIGPLQPAGEAGAEGHQLSALRLRPHTKVREILEDAGDKISLDGEIDRKKYLVTVYARAVRLAKRAIANDSERAVSFPLAKLGRIIQSLVDLSFEQRDHFIGLATCRDDADRPAYHAVNTTLLSMLLGAELELSKRELHELGVAAFLSQIGRPPPGEPCEGEPIDPSPLWSARAILRSAGLDQTASRVILAIYESKLPYSSSGIPLPGLGLFGRIIAIAECYDALTFLGRERLSSAQAIHAMLTEPETRLDPELLPVFVRLVQ